MSAPRNPPGDPSPDRDNNPSSRGADKLPFSKSAHGAQGARHGAEQGGRHNQEHSTRHNQEHSEYRQQGQQGQQGEQGADPAGSRETLRDQLIEASLSNHVAPVAWSIGRDRIATIREWLAWQEILCSHPELDL